MGYWWLSLVPFCAVENAFELFFVLCFFFSGVLSRSLPAAPPGALLLREAFLGRPLPNWYGSSNPRRPRTVAHRVSRWVSSLGHRPWRQTTRPCASFLMFSTWSSDSVTHSLAARPLVGGFNIDATLASNERSHFSWSIRTNIL